MAIPHSSEVSETPNWRVVVRRPSTIIAAVLVAIVIGGAFIVGQNRVVNPNIAPIELVTSNAANHVRAVSGVSGVTDQYQANGSATGYLTADLDQNLSAQEQLAAANGISQALLDESKAGTVVYAQLPIGKAVVGISPNAANNNSLISLANALSAFPDVSRVLIGFDTPLLVTVTSTTSSSPLALLDEVHQEVAAISRSSTITANVVPSLDASTTNLYGDEPAGIPLVVQGVKSVSYPASTDVSATFKAQAELAESLPDVHGYQVEMYSGSTSISAAIPNRATESAVRDAFQNGAFALPSENITFQFLDAQ